MENSDKTTVRAWRTPQKSQKRALCPEGGTKKLKDFVD
jgi:hypothetical protein